MKNTIFVKSKQDIQKKTINSKNIISISSKTGYGVKKLLNSINCTSFEKMSEGEKEGKFTENVINKHNQKHIYNETNYIFNK